MNRRNVGRTTSILAIVIAVATVSVIIYSHDINRSVQIASLVSMYAAVAAAVIATLQLIAAARTSPGPRSPTEQMAAAVEIVAEMVRTQWEREAVIRSLRHPQPMQTRWSARGQRPAVVGAAKGDTADQPTRHRRGLRGRLDETVSTFMDLPQRQLVVLGDPGSGKTVLAVLLTLELLNRRGSDDPVPVLLPALSWNPARHDLHQWMSDRICEDYPILRNTRLFGEGAPKRLVLQGRILPVLDGLDEIPARLRGAALLGIARAWGPRPIIVTCRTTEYDEAVRRTGALTSATTVALEPMRLDEALRYLREGVQPGRWSAVARYLRDHPKSTLRTVLSNPLMISLARSVYSMEADPAEHAPPSPDELLNERFRDQASIERHLLDAFVTVAYAHRPIPPDPYRPTLSPAAPSWQPAQARRFLSCLARHLEECQTQDIAWWRLHQIVNRRAAQLSLVLATTLVGILASVIVGGLILSARSAAILIATVAVATAASAMLPAYLGAVPNVPVRRAIALDISRSRWENKRPFIIGSLVPGLGVGIIASSAAGWVVGVNLGILAAVVGAIGAGFTQWSLPSDNASAPSPQASLANDRRAALFILIVAATVFGLAVGLVIGIRYGAWRGTLCAAVAGIGVGVNITLGMAYSWFIATRAWCAVKRALPWRLMTFMEDAHRRGLLRQTGAVYQFRHTRLRELLLAQGDAPQTP